MRAASAPPRTNTAAVHQTTWENTTTVSQLRWYRWRSWLAELRRKGRVGTKGGRLANWHSQKGNFRDEKGQKTTVMGLAAILKCHTREADGSKGLWWLGDVSLIEEAGTYGDKNEGDKRQYSYQPKIGHFKGVSHQGKSERSNQRDSGLWNASQGGSTQVITVTTEITTGTIRNRYSLLQRCPEVKSATWDTKVLDAGAQEGDNCKIPQATTLRQEVPMLVTKFHILQGRGRIGARNCQWVRVDKKKLDGIPVKFKIINRLPVSFKIKQSINRFLNFKILSVQRSTEINFVSTTTNIWF